MARYGPEFWAEAVRLATSPGHTTGGVARDLGVSYEALRRYVRQAAVEPVTCGPTSSSTPSTWPSSGGGQDPASSTTRTGGPSPPAWRSASVSSARSSMRGGTVPTTSSPDHATSSPSMEPGQLQSSVSWVASPTTRGSRGGRSRSRPRCYTTIWDTTFERSHGRPRWSHGPAGDRNPTPNLGRPVACWPGRPTADGDGREVRTQAPAWAAWAEPVRRRRARPGQARAAPRTYPSRASRFPMATAAASASS